MLKGDVWKDHGRDVGNSQPYIPSSFDRPPRDISQKISSGYKVKEWQNYLYGLAPALLHGILPKVYWQNFCKFVHAIRIIHQRWILCGQLQTVQALLDECQVEFEEIYVQCNPAQLHFVRPWVHASLHLGLEVSRLGPPTLYSTWTMEQTIGILGQEIHQPSNSYHNLSKRGLDRSRLNAIEAMIPGILNRDKGLPQSSWDLGDGYALLRAQEQTTRHHDGIIGDTITNYIIQTELSLGNTSPPGWQAKITR